MLSKIYNFQWGNLGTWFSLIMALRLETFVIKFNSYFIVDVLWITGYCIFSRFYLLNSSLEENLHQTSEKRGAALSQVSIK